MSKGLKVIGLIIFGCIILIVSFLSIRYVIHSDGDKYSADADYVSIDKIEDADEERQEIMHETIEKESFADAFESFITEEPAVELEAQDDEVVDEEANEGISEESIEEIVSNEGISEEGIEEKVSNEGISEESVEETVSNEGVSEESVEEMVSNEEPNEEESVPDEALIDTEIIEYTGDEYIDTTIHEHRDEIADEDIVSGLSIADRIDSNVVYGYLEDGLTDEERGELSYYLHSILTDAEYAKLKELFNKYNYILE